jgi:integrase/recombinase XerD
MATLKLTLDNRRTYKNGTHPLIFRLTHQQKSTSINIGVRLFKNEWDTRRLIVKRAHPNCKQLNAELRKTHSDYELKMITILKDNHLNLGSIKEQLVRKPQLNIVYFKSFVDSQIKSLKVQKRFGNAESYSTASNRLLKFTGKSLELNQINYKLITSFTNQLSYEGICINSIAVYLRAIRAIINLAAKEDLYDLKNYPFKKFQIKTTKTVSRAIEVEDFNKIIGLTGLNKEQIHARDIFILIFSLIGISFTDLALLKKSNIVNGRIVYTRKKTGKFYSIKLSLISIGLLKKYSNNNSEFLLPKFGTDKQPESKVRHQIKLSLKSINRYLKQIGNKAELQIPLTTYVARYSWANIAKSNGFSKDLIAEALGHSYGNHVTGIYLEGYGNEVIDNANDTILTQLPHGGIIHE